MRVKRYCSAGKTRETAGRRIGPRRYRDVRASDRTVFLQVRLHDVIAPLMSMIS